MKSDLCMAQSTPNVMLDVSTSTFVLLLFSPPHSLKHSTSSAQFANMRRRYLAGTCDLWSALRNLQVGIIAGIFIVFTICLFFCFFFCEHWMR